MVRGRSRLSGSFRTYIGILGTSKAQGKEGADDGNHKRRGEDGRKEPPCATAVLRDMRTLQWKRPRKRWIMEVGSVV